MGRCRSSAVIIGPLRSPCLSDSISRDLAVGTTSPIQAALACANRHRHWFRVRERFRPYRAVVRRGMLIFVWVCGPPAFSVAACEKNGEDDTNAASFTRDAPTKAAQPMNDHDVKKRYASSTDVARLAGVSQSAVSRTFTEGASVSAKTRKKVIEAAAELGYQPSIIPRIMLTQKSALVGIVIGGMYNPYYTHIVELLANSIQGTGSSVLLFTVAHGEYFDEAIPMILSYRVDGVISALSIISNEAADSCAKMKIPIVVFNGRLMDSWVSSVCCDNVGGGRAIADLFIRRGGKKFAYIAGRKGNMASENRLAGYMGRLAEEGVTNVQIGYGDFRYEGACRAAHELFSSSNRPDAIFCANDLMGIGALEVARSEFGIRVPEDVLIAGFDDIPAASWPSLNLTTIQQDAPKMVSAAIKLLSGMIDGAMEAQGSLRLIASPLIERGSTRRA